MKIGILGTGAYGLALASIFCENKNDITMWTKFEDEKNNLVTFKSNEKLLPGFTLDNSVKVTTNILECIENKDLVVIAIPAAFVVDVCKTISNKLEKETIICIASKGIEQESGLFIHQIVNKYLNHENIVVISGPSFAKDVIVKKPLGLTVASTNEEAKKIVEKAFNTSYIKLDYTNDIIGVELCGSIKNVMALASGMLDGLCASDSTKAMFLVLSTNYIEQIISAFNGNKKSIMTFAGIGDLILTCTSTNSRNYCYGKLIGEEKYEESKSYLSNYTVEGYYTLESIYNLLKNKNISIPIINLIYSIINNNETPKKLLEYLI